MIKRSLFLLLVLAAPLAAQQNPDFHREFPPFKIAGNLYWVGTADLSVYLINTPQGNILINSDFPEDLPLVKKNYMKTFKVLKSLPVDLFLGAHGNNFGLKAKYEKMKPGGPNPFIDPAGYKAYIADREAAFMKELERQKKNPGSPAA